MNRYIDVDVSKEKLPPIGAYWTEDLVSLDKSLQQVTSQVNELGRSIEAAKKYCHYPSEHGLTRDESAAIYLYTMEGGSKSFYRVINRILRCPDRRVAIPWFPYLKLLDTALAKLPTVKRNIWRGVPQHVGKQFKKNEELVWWSINSCSSSVSVIKNFLGTKSTLFMVEASTGKDISAYTNYPNEREVVLLPGTQLRVEGDMLDESSKLHVVHLVEVDKLQQSTTPVTGPNGWVTQNNYVTHNDDSGEGNPICPVCGNESTDLADRRNADRADADRALTKGVRYHIGQRTSFCFFHAENDGLTYVCNKKH